MADFDSERDSPQLPALGLLRLALDRDHDPFTLQSRKRGSHELPTAQPYPYAASRPGAAAPLSSSPSTVPSESASSAQKPITTLPTSYTPAAKSKRTHPRSHTSFVADPNDSNLDGNTSATSSGKSLGTGKLSVKDVGGAFDPSERKPRNRSRKKDKKVSIHYESRIDPSTEQPREAGAAAHTPHGTRDGEADRDAPGEWSSADKIAFAAIFVFLIIAMPGLLMLVCHTHGENPRAAKFWVSFGMAIIAFIEFLLAFYASRSPPECLLVSMVVLALAILIRIEIDTILPFLASVLGYDLPEHSMPWCIYSS